MQTRSIRGSGEPAWVSASLNACLRLGSDPRRAWPAATSAAQTGRTHDRTRPMLHGVEKALANQAPSKHNLCLNSHPAKCSRRYCSSLRNCGVPGIGLPASSENAYHSPLVRGVSGESQVREFHLNPVFGRYLRQLAAFGVMAQGMRSDHEEESTLA